MNGDRLLYLTLLVFVLGAVSLYFWRDVIVPRQRRRRERRRRRARHRLREIAYLFWYRVLRPLRTKRLTDQRSHAEPVKKATPASPEPPL